MKITISSDQIFTQCLLIVFMITITVILQLVAYNSGYDNASNSIENRIVDEPTYVESIKEKVLCERRYVELKKELRVE